MERSWAGRGKTGSNGRDGLLRSAALGNENGGIPFFLDRGGKKENASLTGQTLDAVTTKPARMLLMASAGVESRRPVMSLSFCFLCVQCSLDSQDESLVKKYFLSALVLW